VTRKGSRTHRILGRCFLGLMLVSALVTLLIHVRNPQGRFFRAEPAASLCPAGGRFVCDCVVRGGQAPDPASQVRGICVVLRVAGVHRLRADLPGRRDYARDLFRHPRGLQGPAPRCPVMRLIGTCYTTSDTRAVPIGMMSFLFPHSEGRVKRQRRSLRTERI